MPPVSLLLTAKESLKQMEPKKSKRTVKMMCSLYVPPMRMRTFSGLRGSNSLDNNMKRNNQDFHSKVALATSVRRKQISTRIVPKAMFERFTEKAIKVIMLAPEDARRLGHNFDGSEQIFLGLIGEGTGIATKVLKSMGISLKDARVEVEKIIGRGSGFVAVEIPFTPRAKRVLELSLEEARQLGHNYIGSEHLLLGLLREGEGFAARVLENLGADPIPFALMTKRGHQPTGMVVQMAKAGGFTCVSDIIHIKGAQNVSNYKRVQETTSSPRKLRQVDLSHIPSKFGRGFRICCCIFHVFPSEFG